MEKEKELQRYSVIKEKNKREILLLRGRGCVWKKCRFCDYHLDCSKDDDSNFTLNKEQLLKVTGIYKRLEVINSGSFVDLDGKTMKMIEDVCRKKGITVLHFECHWIHREKVLPLKERFRKLGILVKVKIGVETFDSLFRESYLVKGIDTDAPEEIAGYFDECCLLFGLPGQNVASMLLDIQIGLKHFERVCINLMVENQMPIKPAPGVIHEFKEYIYPIYKEDERVDILVENTDFGVGGDSNGK